MTWELALEAVSTPMPSDVADAADALLTDQRAQAELVHEDAPALVDR